MTIPGSAPFASAPYGAQPVIPVIGPEGGPYNVAGPLHQTPLPSAARTATTSTAVQTNSGYKGLYLYLNVTINPGGAQTLAVHVVALNALTGQAADLMTVAASATPGGVYVIYPGGPAAPVDGITAARNAPLPLSWFVTITHSGAGAWTYTLDVDLLS